MQAQAAGEHGEAEYGVDELHHGSPPLWCCCLPVFIWSGYAAKRYASRRRRSSRCLIGLKAEGNQSFVEVDVWVLVLVDDAGADDVLHVVGGDGRAGIAGLVADEVFEEVSVIERR